MVIICDCHYRSALTAIRAFHETGEDIIVVTTERYPNPAAFHSKYIYEKILYPSDKKTYTDSLLSLCERYEKPIVFPAGNFSLNILSENIEIFKKCAKICVSTPEMLLNLNDKKWVKSKADEFGLKVPKFYDLNSECTFPLVVKPFCGEKFNLKANERYKIVFNREELEKAYNYFKKFDNTPLIEEYVEGQGVGVSFILDNDSKAQTVFCHKRLLEYPISGGPSVYLETFYDEKLINDTKAFLEHLGVVGFAMVEYKLTDNGYYLLEINPRIWGSFPSTERAKSDFIKSFVRACNSEESTFTCDYQTNKKIKFMRGLIMSFLSYVKKGDVKKALKCIGVIASPFIPDATFNVKDIRSSIRDFFRR